MGQLFAQHPNRSLQAQRYYEHGHFESHARFPSLGTGTATWVEPGGIASLFWGVDCFGGRS